MSTERESIREGTETKRQRNGERMRKEAERDEREKKEVGREKERRENNGMRKGGNEGGGLGEIKAVEKKESKTEEGEFRKVERNKQNSG